MTKEGLRPFPNVRCPKCNFRPRRHDRWMCDCTHTWNTFETQGQCPQCNYQWQDTACLHCLEWSPHNEWYCNNNDDQNGPGGNNHGGQNNVAA